MDKKDKKEDSSKPKLPIPGWLYTQIIIDCSSPEEMDYFNKSLGLK